MAGFDSISSLLKKKPGGDDDSPQGLLLAKEDELRLKQIEEETEVQAGVLGFDYINLFSFPISPEALSLISENDAREMHAVCFYYDGENIRIGTTKEPSTALKKLVVDLDAKHFTKSRWYLISENSFNSALEEYKILPKIIKYEGGVEIKEEDLEKFSQSIADYRKLRDQINNVNISDIITLILATALKTDASDIHIEAEAAAVVVRLRIDGVLQEAATINKNQWRKIVSRLKILAGVKINVNDQPQDGRFSIFLKSEKIDVRTSFLPTAFGESVVMRLLRSKTAGLPFDDLGLRPGPLAILIRELDRPNGLILTTGPTGSGKTTTLYAVLKRLNKPGTKIITLEDPIEYQLKGISQSQIQTDKGYTFAEGLRSILRQDPNVIMVGEIRDLETAEIAIQSSLTGHLVLSTLHTNDAAGVIPRLIDMGVKPYFLVPAINAVLGQRLVRKLCPHCKVEKELSEEDRDRVNRILAVISPKSGVEVPATLPAFYSAGSGCDDCNGTGYKGRLGIYEVFTMDDKIKKLTIDSAPAFEILRQAIENGMITMLQDGVLKAVEGITSLEEVYRVAGDFDYVDALYDLVVSKVMGRGVKLSKADLSASKALMGKPEEIAKIIKAASAPELLKTIFALAISSRAGDIHIDPSELEVKVRFRIDGILYDMFSVSPDHYLPVLGEVKILSGFETNVKQAAMDGRFSVFMDKNKIDCRVSIISGGYGETIVIRLLADEANALKMSDLGIEDYSLLALQEAIKKTKGLILVTGPTGSGKTTTLYSLLKVLNKPEVKIITVEDPIEYQVKGVMQTQINASQGYTFALALRSLLRQNPNVMMIGEIRDEETAKIAIEAALTGHLVLSTIHANSASSAISRFFGLGVDRALLANSIESSVGQRLARRICPNCRAEEKISEADLKRVQEILASIKNEQVKIPKELKFYRGTGCSECNNLGFKDRMGLYEVINPVIEVRKAIQNAQLTDAEIEDIAVKNGMVTMIQDGVLKALKGETTISEVFRVCD